MALYILSFHILQSNSRTSNLWKLNAEEGKIVEGSPFPKIVPLSEPQTTDDPVFNIITSTIHYGKSWTKRSIESYTPGCHSTHFGASDRFVFLIKGGFIILNEYLITVLLNYELWFG